MKTKLMVVGAALVGALTLGLVSAGARQTSQTFTSGLYQNQPYTCAHGSAIDPSGQSFGIFQAIEIHNYAWVHAYVRVDNMKPFLLYRVFVTEYGVQCISPTLAPGYEWASFTANAKGQGSVDFWFPAAAGETSAWVTVRHGTEMTVRSAAVPINR